MVSLLWIIAAILFIGWLLGLGGAYAIGSAVHILLVLAIIAVIVNLFTGRRTTVV